MGCSSSSEKETVIGAGESMQPRVLQQMEEAGFPVDIPPDLAPHRKEARQAARLAVAKALEADEAERLAHVAAEAARAAAAADPAYVPGVPGGGGAEQQTQEQQQGTSLEEMEALMKEAPMKLLLFEDLRAFQAIPRSNEAVPHKYLHDVPTAERPDDCIVFVSHRWFAPSLDPNEAHPDKEGLKFAIIIKAVEEIKRGLKPGTKVYLWIDFFCIDQDNVELKIKGIMCLPAYICNSDCLLTPWTDKVFDNLVPGATYQLPPFSQPDLEKFKSLALDNPGGYFARGWCRLEIYCGIALKVKEGTFRYFLQKGIAARADQRPHFLAGDYNDGTPFLLPPLVNSVWRALNPVEGHLTSETDLVHIQTLVDQNPLPPDAATGYWGDSSGATDEPYHGVDYSFKNGNRYEGQWRDDQQQGRGVNTDASGETYAGDLVGAEYEGAGVYRFASGSTYRGQWAGSRRAGHGVWTYAWGGRYAGGFADDAFSGPAMYWWPPEVLPGGGVEECSWAANARDGAYVLTRPGGARVEGARSPANDKGGPFAVYAPDGARAAEGLDLDAALARSLEL